MTTNDLVGRLQLIDARMAEDGYEPGHPHREAIRVSSIRLAKQEGSGMTIPELVEQVEAGCTMRLSNQADCVRVIEWVHETTKDLSGWKMEVHPDIDPPTITISKKAKGSRKP